MSTTKNKIEKEREACADLCDYMATLGEEVIKSKKDMPEDKLFFAAGLIEGYRHAAEQIRARGKNGTSQ